MIVAALAVLAACSNGGDAAPTPTATAPSTASPTPTPEPVWPLTGLPADAAAGVHPVLVVKIDNTGNAEPQLGLSQADLVVEELVEGGLTRLAAMFHSTLPEVVGPVRSVRTTDIGIVAPTGGALAASGGASRVLRQIDDAGLTVLTESSAGFSRAGDRSAPYNVMLDPAAAMDTIAELSPPAQPYLPWGTGTARSSERGTSGEAERDQTAAPADGAAVTTADVQFSRGHTTSWQWGEAGWQRVDDLAADGDAFAASALLILRVTTRDAGYEDPGGNPVPETVLEGSGEAILLAGNLRADGRWSKESPAAPFVLTSADGQPMTVPPGHTWIELVPEAGSVTTS